MQINGPGPINNVSSVKPTGRAQNAQASQSSSSIDTNDELTLSSEAQALTAASTEEVRYDKVSQIRQQIADGSYETAEKLDVALDRLLDQLG